MQKRHKRPKEGLMEANNKQAKQQSINITNNDHNAI